MPTTASLAHRERAAVCDALLSAGAAAPTLCAGWTCHDLTAHLYIREHRPDAGPGLLVAALSGWTQRVQDGARRRGFAELVAAVRSGPPRLSLFALPGVDRVANTVEYLVHHEDVRRAAPGWTPREFDAADRDTVWSQLRLASRRGLGRAPARVTLQRDDGSVATLTAGPAGAPQVVVAGAPLELLLFSLGRQAQAQVSLTGDGAAVAALNAATLGL